MTYEDLKDLVENESRQFVMNALIMEGILFETNLNSSWGQIGMIVKLEEGHYTVVWDGLSGELVSLEPS